MSDIQNIQHNPDLIIIWLGSHFSSLKHTLRSRVQQGVKGGTTNLLSQIRSFIPLGFSSRVECGTPLKSGTLEPCSGTRLIDGVLEVHNNQDHARPLECPWNHGASNIPPKSVSSYAGQFRQM